MSTFITRLSVCYDKAFPNGVERVEYKARNYYGIYGQYDEIEAVIDGGAEPRAIELLRDDYLETHGLDIFEPDDGIFRDLSR